MKDFIITGSFRPGKKCVKLTKNRTFSRAVTSHNDRTAVEKVYSLLGSEHSLKRYRIKIESVNEA